MAIYYSSNRTFLPHSVSSSALQLHPPSDRKLLPTPASSHHYQIPPHRMQIVPLGLLSHVLALSPWIPPNKPLSASWCAKAVTTGFIPLHSFLPFAQHPKISFLIAPPESPLKQILFPVPSFPLSSGGQPCKAQVFRSTDFACLPRRHGGKLEGMVSAGYVAFDKPMPSLGL